MRITVNQATLARIAEIQKQAQAQIDQISQGASVRISEMLQAIVEATPGADLKAVWGLKGSELIMQQAEEKPNGRKAK